MAAATALLLFLTLAAQVTAPPRDAKPVAGGSTATLAGRVVDAETDAPIPEAIVSVSRSRTGDRPTQLEADERGGFRVTGLAPGDYRVIVSAPEHRPTHVSKVWNVDPNVVNSLRPSVQLVAGERREDIVVRLDRALVIEGRVVDEMGEPMAAARVSVERLAGLGISGGSQPATDDRGLFRAFGLAAGTYRLCASPGYSPADRYMIRGAAGTVVEQPYVRTCSSHVVLRPGGAPHVALVMSRVTGYSVSGRVASESGRQLLNVRLSRVDEPEIRDFEAQTRDGAFVARGIPPGEYVVRATGTPATPGPSEPEVALMSIRIDAADVSGVELVTRKGATLTGQIVPEVPLPAGSKLTVVRGMTYKRMPAMSIGQAVVRDDRTFELRDVHEPTLFAVGGLPRGWAMTSVRYRGVEVIDTITTFASTPDPSQLQIVVSPRSAQVRVRAVDANGRIVEGARIMLIAATGDRVALSAVYAVEPAADGSREIPPTRPGEYLVIALRPDEVMPPSPNFASLLRQLGKPVVLEADDRRTIDVVVVTLPEGR